MIRVIVFLTAYLFIAQAINILDDSRSVFTIPYTRYFRKDKIGESMGCGKRIAYASWTFPDGARDALHISTNPHAFGGVFNCAAR